MPRWLSYLVEVVGMAVTVVGVWMTTNLGVAVVVAGVCTVCVGYAIEWAED